LNEEIDADHKLTILSAPAGFWKTTLVSEWIASCERPAAWLSLEFAEPGGFIRLFVDEGVPMAEMLTAAIAQGFRPGYISRLLAAFAMEKEAEQRTLSGLTPSSLVEPLSPRELEILRLIAEGLSNQEIGKQLFLALDTIKGHNRRIFEKLQVQRRTEAIARARALGLL
jgi:LuxR family maltose regulon positive regulatory protein